MPKLYVIGFGFKPFEDKTKKILYDSDFILASERLFDFFTELKEYEKVKDKVKVINNVDRTFEFIKSNPNAEIVILASGDPLFYGIGRRAVEEVGKDSVTILPDLSSIQVAFARIKESWDNAFLMSLHGGPDPNKRRKMTYEITELPRLIKKYQKIAILTDKENNPTNIAKALLNSNELKEDEKNKLKIFVCEKLGYPDEAIIEGTPFDISQGQFRNPNLVILLNKNLAFSNPDSDIVFGIREEEIIHSDGLITKDEIRAITLHKLELTANGVFWDIGAGSGSVSIEVAKLCPKVKVYAIEKNLTQVENIQKNIERHKTSNVKIIPAEAPSALTGLPKPDRAFIGGSGGKIEEIINHLTEIFVKVIVINAATIQTLNKALSSLQGAGYEIEACQINVSRMRKIGKSNYFSALNPVFVIKGKK
ncbi:MAG: precorrin-6y C5,15-methyltransferase (decarboxylating) subunit CbiE [Thermodesulfovibrionales bacterium]|nr:precorrin-6y C5,15-methyltransferase (decarboxylating) subunit CbiE [Thermodesulfovibrionales bacterium]